MGLLFVYGLHLLVFQDQAASQSFPSRLFVISGTNDEITCKFIRLPVAHMNFTLLMHMSSSHGHYRQQIIKTHKCNFSLFHTSFHYV